MKPGGPEKLSIGWIIVDCILIAGVIMDIQAGQLALNKWCMVVVASVILGILLIKLFKKRIEKERKQSKSTIVEEHTNTDSHEES